MKNENSQHTPTPWQWLPSEGNFIGGPNGETIAEIPGQGCNLHDGAFIVHVVNNYSAYQSRINMMVNALAIADSAIRDLSEALLKKETGDRNRLIYHAKQCRRAIDLALHYHANDGQP